MLSEDYTRMLSNGYNTKAIYPFFCIQTAILIHIHNQYLQVQNILGLESLNYAN